MKTPEYSIVSVLLACTLALAICPALSWTSPAIPKLKAIFPALTVNELSWLSSLSPLGAIFGPYFFSFLADKIGRKYALLCASLPVTASYLLMVFYQELLGFYLARFVSGFSMGGSFAVMPMYVGEVSSIKHRGFLGATMTVFTACGLLLSYALGPYVELNVFNVVLAILPLTFFVMFLILGVESPYYYVSKNKMNRATEILTKIRKTTSTEIDAELCEIKFITKQTQNVKIWHIFGSKVLRKAELICIGLVFFYQGTGINAILSFSQEIFKVVGTHSTAISSLICGFMLLLATIVAALLIHKFNRRTLLILSTSGMVLSLGVLGVYLCLQERNIYSKSLSFVPLLSLVLFIVTFNLGLGPIVWVAQGEFFPTDLRASAGALNSSICWTVSFVVTQFFEPISSVIGLGESFLILAVVSLLAVTFCFYFVLETKGKSLREIQLI